MLSLPLAEIPKDGEHTSQSFERLACVRGSAGAGRVSDKGVGGAVVGGGRPVQRDRNVRGHGETVGRRSVESGAVLVLDGHEVELASTHLFGAEEGKGVRDTSVVDG